MPSPDLELQGEIVKRLKADPGVAALVADRIYDSVPPGVVFPYVTYGPTDSTNEDAECIRAYAVAVQLDAWSRKPGSPEVKAIADAVERALHDAALPLPTNALVYIRHDQTRTFRDPDGLTSHAAMSFESVVEYP
jgi:hypothetical protein